MKFRMLLSGILALMAGAGCQKEFTPQTLREDSASEQRGWEVESRELSLMTELGQQFEIPYKVSVIMQAYNKSMSKNFQRKKYRHSELCFDSQSCTKQDLKMFCNRS